MVKMVSTFTSNVFMTRHILFNRALNSLRFYGVSEYVSDMADPFVLSMEDFTCQHVSSMQRSEFQVENECWHVQVAYQP